MSKEALLKRISSRRGHHDFKNLFFQWEKQRPNEQARMQSTAWLQCVDFYLEQDLDHDGTPDWSAIVNGEPSVVLFPQDNDIDGDGTSNLFDPHPYNAQFKGNSNTRDVPDHLKLNEPRAAYLQQKIFQEFKILALDHTDTHSPVVLENLLFLLKNGFSKKFRPLNNIQAIYAFSGHDGQTDIAAFHPQAKAISIGGVSSYGNRTSGIHADILATLAHEWGHAFLFDRISPKELKQVSKKFGGWGPTFGIEAPDNLYASVFFKSHPSTTSQEAKKFSLVSGYSRKNVHEWFADAFAAEILDQVGRSAEYKPVTEGFSKWLKKRMTSG